MDVCEKIYKAVTVCPAFQAIRNISHRRQTSRPASPAPNSSLPTLPLKTIDIESKPDPPRPPKSIEAADLVPISFDYSIQAPPHEKPKPATRPVPIEMDGQVASKTKPEATTPTNQSPGKVNQTNPKVEPPHINKEEGKKLATHIEDTFTDYINRAKIKIRTMSHVRHDHKKTSGKDKFSDYIDRAGVKIRTTSSIGSGGRSSSFK